MNEGANLYGIERFTSERRNGGGGAGGINIRKVGGAAMVVCRREGISIVLMAGGDTIEKGANGGTAIGRAKAQRQVRRSWWRRLSGNGRVMRTRLTDRGGVAREMSAGLRMRRRYICIVSMRNGSRSARCRERSATEAVGQRLKRNQLTG